MNGVLPCLMSEREPAVAEIGIAVILPGPRRKIESLELKLIEFESDKVERGEVLEEEWEQWAGGEEEEGEAERGRLLIFNRGQRVKLIGADAACAGLCLEMQREHLIVLEQTRDRVITSPGRSLAKGKITSFAARFWKMDKTVRPRWCRRGNTLHAEARVQHQAIMKKRDSRRGFALAASP